MNASEMQEERITSILRLSLFDKRVVRQPPSFLPCVLFPWHPEADFLLYFSHNHRSSRPIRCTKQMVNIRGVLWAHFFPLWGLVLENPLPQDLHPLQLSLLSGARPLTLSGPVCDLPRHLLCQACRFKPAVPPLDTADTGSCLGWETWLQLELSPAHVKLPLLWPSKVFPLSLYYPGLVFLSSLYTWCLDLSFTSLVCRNPLCSHDHVKSWSSKLWCCLVLLSTRDDWRSTNGLLCLEHFYCQDVARNNLGVGESMLRFLLVTHVQTGEASLHPHSVTHISRSLSFCEIKWRVGKKLLCKL